MPKLRFLEKRKINPLTLYPTSARSPTTVVRIKALDTLRQILGEDTSNSVLVEVIDTYLEETPKQLEALQEAVKMGDIVTVKMIAHTLKPTSETLGAIALSYLCKELEAMVRAGDPTEALSLKVRQIVVECEQVKLALQAERNLCQS